MTAFLASGHVVDLVLGVIALEACILLTLRRRRRDGPAAIDIVLMLLPGVMLLLALRAALVQASWGWIALCLALSFPLHLADIARRWQMSRP